MNYGEIRFLNPLRLFMTRFFITLSLSVYYFSYTKSNDRNIAEYIKTHADKEDLLVFTNLSVVSFRYYCQARTFSNILAFPEIDFGYLPREALNADKAYLNSEVSKVKTEISRLLSQKIDCG